MILIASERGEGKTTKLIELSEQLQIPIACHNDKSANHVRDMAAVRGKNIPRPIVYESSSFRGRREILIDELSLLPDMYGTKIVAASIDIDSIDFKSVTFFELIGMWWRHKKADKYKYKKLLKERE